MLVKRFSFANKVTTTQYHSLSWDEVLMRAKFFYYIPMVDAWHSLFQMFRFDKTASYMLNRLSSSATAFAVRRKNGEIVVIEVEY